jgi:hypothetical protein
MSEPTLADVAAQFPRWETFEGVNGLIYARLPRLSPPVLVRGEDPMDLRDELRRAESQLERGTYWQAELDTRR